MENAEISTGNQLPKPSPCLPAQGFLIYKAQFPAYLRHPCHPSGLDKCTFAGTFTKQLCLPGPHLVCLRNGDALAWFSGG